MPASDRMNGPTGKVIIAALFSALITLGGSNVLQWAAFFRNTVTVDELKPVIERQILTDKQVTKVETILEQRLLSIEKSIGRLETKMDAQGVK